MRIVNVIRDESSFAQFEDIKTNKTKLVFIILDQQQCKEPS